MSELYNIQSQIILENRQYFAQFIFQSPEACWSCTWSIWYQVHSECSTLNLSTITQLASLSVDSTLENLSYFAKEFTILRLIRCFCEKWDLRSHRYCLVALLCCLVFLKREYCLPEILFCSLLVRLLFFSLVLLSLREGTLISCLWSYQGYLWWSRLRSSWNTWREVFMTLLLLNLVVVIFLCYVCQRVKRDYGKCWTDLSIVCS